MTAYPLKDFTTWAEGVTLQLGAILQGQEDAKRRMVDLIEALKSKDDWDDSVIGLMNSMSEQILAAAGDNLDAIALADEVKERAGHVAKLLSEKTFAALQERGVEK